MFFFFQDILVCTLHCGMQPAQRLQHALRDQLEALELVVLDPHPHDDRLLAAVEDRAAVLLGALALQKVEALAALGLVRLVNQHNRFVPLQRRFNLA